MRESLMETSLYWKKQSEIMSLQEDVIKTRKYMREAEKFQHEGNYYSAIELFDKALNSEPSLEHSYILNNKGVAFYRLAQYNNAIECYDEAIKLTLSILRLGLTRV